MATLHTVNKSPFERTSLQRCMDFALPGCAILLLEDGVYAARTGSDYAQQLKSLADVRVFVLGPDAQARGVSVDATIGVVDYVGFVELAVEFSKVQSWL
jgi:tRNA 2-thiouridine synthesizing protein B